jgi:hypothetical protein
VFAFTDADLTASGLALVPQVIEAPTTSVRRTGRGVSSRSLPFVDARGRLLAKSERSLHAGEMRLLPLK